MKHALMNRHDGTDRVTDIGGAVMVAAYWFGYAFTNYVA